MSNYSAGARIERMARNVLQLNGYSVTRSAGSKGAVDLIASNDFHFRLIQCKKAGSWGKGDFDKLLTHKAPITASRELWEWDGGDWYIWVWDGANGWEKHLGTDLDTPALSVRYSVPMG